MVGLVEKTIDQKSEIMNGLLAGLKLKIPKQI